MNSTRHDFLKGALAALGFSALPGGLFAAPPRWKPKKKPHLVFGILSDTHLQSGWDGVTPHRGFPLTYVINAMKLFRSCNIDAFMHLGDMAHRGKNVEVQYHRDIFDKFFPQGVRSSDKRNVEKLLVVMVVFERHEVGEGGKLGPDWVLPLGEFKPHPFTRNELKKVIGEPQFGKKAKLEVKLEKKVGVGERNNSAGKSIGATIRV